MRIEPTIIFAKAAPPAGERWITINGGDGEGQHVLIKEGAGGAEVVGGAGGSLDGKKLGDKKPEKPDVKEGDHVKFETGEHKGRGDVIATGTDGVQVKDAKDGVHRVLHEDLTHKLQPATAPAEKPDPNAQPKGASGDAVKVEKVRQKKNGSWGIDSAINDKAGNKVGFTDTEETPDAVTMRTVMIEDDDAKGKGLGLQAYRDTINYALEQGKTFQSDKEVSESARKVYARLEKLGYKVEQSPDVTEDDYGRLHSKDKGPVFKITGQPLHKSFILFLKSMVAGYTRKDGVVVKPHADKRVKRAQLDPHQLVLFPAPAKKPIPPNPFKGLDPVKSTGDLFDDHKPAPAMPSNESDQDRSHREWAENWGDVMGSDLSKVSDRNLARAYGFGSHVVMMEHSKAQAGKPWNEHLVNSVKVELEAIKAEEKRRRM